MRHRALLAVAALLATAGPVLPALAGADRPTHPDGSAPAIFRVGAASVTIDPGYPLAMGGYGPGPASGTMTRHTNPLTGQPEDLTVRAISIQSATGVVELARVDSQGWFAGYEEGPYGISDTRQAAASFLQTHGVPGATEANIIVSTLHEHATPTIMGVWAPPAPALPYLEQVAAATRQALEQAFLAERRATITWGRGDAPWLASTVIARGNTQEGWPPDGSLFTLWARDASTGATIATYVVQPGYPNIVKGPNDLVCPGGVAAAVLSTDFPSYTQNYLEARLGGVAMVADGTLGSQPGPMQDDTSISKDLPPQTVTVNGSPVSCQQATAFDDAIHMGIVEGNLISEALASGHYLTSPVVAAAEQYVLTPVYNPALIALLFVAPVDGGQPWDQAGLGDQLAYPVDRSSSPPYAVGDAVGTWVTGIRLGDVLLLSEPGEFFPSIHQAWDAGIKGAADVVAIGMGQDQLGYNYPAYAYPSTQWSADEQLFNPSLTLGDQVVTAGEQDAQALGFQVDYTSNAEVTALDNDYTRILRPGVQLIPFPQSGDLDSSGNFTTTLQGFATAARFGPSPTTMGAISWTFGDGTTGTSGHASNDYFTHTYHRPGVYWVTATATDSRGQQDSETLPVTVYPAVQPSITSNGDTLTARVTGGSGRVLFYQWTMPDGTSAWGPTVQAPSSGTVTLTVVDGTGDVATITTTINAFPGATHGCDPAHAGDAAPGCSGWGESRHGLPDSATS
ncbi:MAG TPA: PKD domain-containing protein [Mycobacteriales bacterium]|nr:PKD domain-containing protein [Mycobacteriales bacterium]